MSCCGKRRAAASTSLAASMTTAATTTPIAFAHGRAKEFASLAIQEWMECLYHGRVEMLLQGPITGEHYHLRPGMPVKLSHRDWPILKRTGLLQPLMS